jgi:hypothetical protein
MKKTIPVHKPKDLTVAWAQAVAIQHDQHAMVKQVDIISVDVGTTTRVRIAVSYANDTTLPGRWFIKLPSLAWRAKMITALPRLLPTEVRFYREIAGDLPIASPKCLMAHSLFGLGSTLVLADVTESDATAGFTSDSLSREQALSVIENLAIFHAHFWHDDTDSHQYPWLHSSVRQVEDALGTVLAEALMQRGLKKAESVIASTLHKPALRYARERKKVMQFLNQNAKTLVHHDCHPGNLYWQKDKSPGFLDWQLVRSGEGLSDVAYFLATALSPETRRLHERELLDCYWQMLQKQGIATFDEDLQLQRYRAHLSYPFEAMVITLSIGGMMNASCNLELIKRAAAAIEDWDAFSALGI